MGLKMTFVALSMACLLERSAANGHLQAQSKWRACTGNPTNVMYITGTSVTYAPSWAGTNSTNALLDAGKSSDAELEAACAALVPVGQVGEIYEMTAAKAGNGCTTCLRMATYMASEAGLLVGTVSDTGAQRKWVCGKSSAPPVQPSCPVISAESKWRACTGNPANSAYITGTSVTYSPSWATTNSQSTFLDAGKNSTAQLQAACSALLAAGQVGEIYTMTSANAGNGCTNCLRMAIYNASENGKVVGTVSDTGAQTKWVCRKDTAPPARPACTTASPTPAPTTTPTNSDASSAVGAKHVMAFGILMLRSAWM